MNCQNCGVRPATFHFRQVVNGREREVNLCAHCASHMKVDFSGPFSSLENILEGFFGPRPKGKEGLLGRLTESANLVLQAGAETAVRLGYEQLGTEFLLYGILREPNRARDILCDLGLDLGQIEQHLDESVTPQKPQNADKVYLTPRMKRVIELANNAAMELGLDYISPELLLLGVLLEKESVGAQILLGAGIDPEKLWQTIANQSGRPTEKTLKSTRLPENLAKYTRDLTEMAKQGKMDPIIGRDAEIERVIRILSRKTKNNPVLMGEPGVGKTAIGEGLAQRIASGEVPDLLRDKVVLSLDLGGLVAGTKFRGEFEERIKSIMDEIRQLNGKAIIFIDELHNLVGAGGAEGSIDASSMLKPALARGEMQVVGATTLDDYRKYIEKDAALERRFQPVLVAEPTPEETIEILRGLRDSYEAHHRVKITDEGIVAAVELSDRYITDRFLPDKAIDLMDEACAMERLSNRTASEQWRKLEDEIAKKEKDKNAAIAGQDFEGAASLRDDIEKLKDEFDAVKRDWQRTKGSIEPTVTPEEIATVVGEWTGIPARRLLKDEMQRLMEMEKHIGRRVIGQEEAISAISEAVRRSRAGLKDPNRPIGSFIFLGPTGVGKTELARALADYLFNDENAMIRLDMSEYMEKHTVSRLVGAPPGYVGYEEAGQLTEQVRRRPYCVILFDEIEKAHPDVFNILLQILDAGRLTDSKGRTVDFKNAVIIMTSNVGAASIAKAGNFGFRVGAEEGPSWDKIKETTMDALKAAFKPEFINRLDDIIIFHPLSRDQIYQIVDLMLEATRRKLHGQRIGLELTDAAKEGISRLGYDPTYGARPLRRAIQRYLETPISRLILQGEFSEGDTIRVDFAEEQFTFFKTPKEVPIVSGPREGEIEEG